MNPHPAASFFPLMDGNDLAALVDDVRTVGLLEPITLHEGLVLDGRNRLRACELAGVKPRFEDWDGSGSPVEFVISKNLHRRHLTTGQRAALALDLLPHLEAEAHDRQGKRTDLRPKTDEGLADAGRADVKAAEMVGVGRTTVADAKAIQKRDESGDVVNAMRAGELNVSQAARKVGIVGHGNKPAAGSYGLPTERDARGFDIPKISYGKGDKWGQSSEPLRRYLSSWSKRGFEFRHVNPREAERRVKLIDELVAGLAAAREDLASRTERAKMRAV